MDISASEYGAKEELANTLTHGLGAVLALFALAYMLVQAQDLSPSAIAAVSIYGISLILLFSCSTFYHASTDQARRVILKRLDHCAIYLLIAGTYTPFMVISLKTDQAYFLLAIEWLLVAIGIVFKMFFIHKFKAVSLAAYLIMGWLVVFVSSDLKQVINQEGFNLLLAGGITYSVGAVFYALKKLPFTHAIWHLFVVAGALLHCAAITFYVIPNG